MQQEVRKAAFWYLENFTSDINELENELKQAYKVRAILLERGTVEQIERSFAAVEILKAAYAMLNNEIYDTDFSATALNIIRKNSYQKPKLFVCKKCGCLYPASAFPIDYKTKKQSHFCIRCVKDIDHIQKQYKKLATGYINCKGAIICSAA